MGETDAVKTKKIIIIFIYFSEFLKIYKLTGLPSVKLVDTADGTVVEEEVKRQIEVKSGEIKLNNFFYFRRMLTIPVNLYRNGRNNLAFDFPFYCPNKYTDKNISQYKSISMFIHLLFIFHFYLLILK